MAYDKSRLADLLSMEKTTDIVNELVVVNEGLIFSQLKKFGMQHDTEAMSIGYEALFIAIKTFDNSKNNAFSTYATVCIYNKLGSYVRYIKSRIPTVSYDVGMNDEEGESFLSLLESTDRADERCLQAASVSHISSLVKKQYLLVEQPIQKKILAMWIKAGFDIPLVVIATKLNCSQSYVSKTINAFRKSLNYKLEAVK